MSGITVNVVTSGIDVDVQGSVGSAPTVTSGSAVDVRVNPITWEDVGEKPTTFPPSLHSHAASDTTSGVFSVARLPVGVSASTVAAGNDARLTDSREWTAETISKVEAEVGTATTRRAFTAQRVFQAIAGWWAGSPEKIKLDGVQVGATANATNEQLRDRATHTGSQDIITITSSDSAGRLVRTGVGGFLETLAVGTKGQVLRVNNAGSNVEWGPNAPLPPGSEGQVMRYVDSAWASSPDVSWNELQGKPEDFVPSAHAASHLPEGSDQLFNQSLNMDAAVEFARVKSSGGEVALADWSYLAQSFDGEQSILSVFLWNDSEWQVALQVRQDRLRFADGTEQRTAPKHFWWL